MIQPTPIAFRPHNHQFNLGVTKFVTRAPSFLSKSGLLNKSSKKQKSKFSTTNVPNQPLFHLQNTNHTALIIARHPLKSMVHLIFLVGLVAWHYCLLLLKIGHGTLDLSKGLYVHKQDQLNSKPSNAGSSSTFVRSRNTSWGNLTKASGFISTSVIRSPFETTPSAPPSYSGKRRLLY
jgi:hypothetical protein